jgi:outer membrane protein TolC
VKKTIEQAEENLRIESGKYTLGKGSMTDVLDAQTALLESQTHYHRALADYHVALARLKLAKGTRD